MDAALFAKSFTLGLAVAAPIGPIGMLCISRTLECGVWAGLAGGVGTAIADAIYASLAAFGFATFASVIATIDAPLRIVGGLFMLWLGIKSFRPMSPPQVARVGARGLPGTVAATFLLTIVNPMTIVSFAAMFAALGLAESAEWSASITVVTGVFVGSLLWWVLLSSGVALAGRRLPDGFSRIIAKLSSAVLILLGLHALLSVAWKLSLP